MNKTNNNGPVFVVHYDPRLPSINSIVNNHWRTMVGQDPQLKETFPLPPLAAYKVAPNLKYKLVRAKVPSKPPARPKRVVPGMTRFDKAHCNSCLYILTGNCFKATAKEYKK